MGWILAGVWRQPDGTFSDVLGDCGKLSCPAQTESSSEKDDEEMTMEYQPTVDDPASNVFVCRRGDLYDVVKLLDFGLVQATATDESAGRLTQAGGIVGTPEYMSPEQADTPFAVDGRSDIYALGGVLHFMLTGRPPFSGRTMVELLIAHRQQTLPPLRGLACEVSDELEHMLQRCMAKLTGARFADVAMLATAAEACRESKGWNEERSRQWWLSQPVTSMGAPL